MTPVEVGRILAAGFPVPCDTHPTRRAELLILDHEKECVIALCPECANDFEETGRVMERELVEREPGVEGRA